MEQERKPLVKPKANPTVVLQATPAALFSDAGKTFSLRSALPVQDAAPVKERDWKQIACDFLSRNDELEPLSSGDPDTSRAAEFIAGGGAQNWNELRKAALEDSKDKARKYRK